MAEQIQNDMFGGQCNQHSAMTCGAVGKGNTCVCHKLSGHTDDHTCLHCGMSFKAQVAHARRTDPETSHEAAVKVTPHIRQSQAEVLGLFKNFGDMTDLVLVRVANGLQSSSGLRTRRSELVAQGVLERKGKIKQEGANRIVWGLSESHTQEGK